LGEEVAGSKKVSDFLAGISDPRLNTGMDIVDGNTLCQTDFEKCQQFFKTLIEHQKTRSKCTDTDAKRPGRRIVKLEAQLKAILHSNINTLLSTRTSNGVLTISKTHTFRHELPILCANNNKPLLEPGFKVTPSGAQEGITSLIPYW
jgi:hypothetical protein